jgi:glycerol uptake facilitator protein
MDEPRLAQQLAAEVIGTAFLVFIGVGSVPATLIVNGSAPFTMADLGVISLAFGTVVVATVYALGHISGHKASEVGLGVAHYSAPVGAGQAFVAEFVGTFILVFTIFGVIHRKASAGFAGLAIGLVVFAAIIPVAPATGASINPARTVGPMLVQQLAGGTIEWRQLPVYLAAEFLAGVVAALAYVTVSRTAADKLSPATAASGPDLADGGPVDGATVVRAQSGQPA